MSDYVYTKCKSQGFHLSLCSEKDVVELPGRTERVEMAFSRVMVDVSSHHCTARIFLTNFRCVYDTVCVCVCVCGWVCGCVCVCRYKTCLQHSTIE